jgi:hypothetical protein
LIARSFVVGTVRFAEEVADKVSGTYNAQGLVDTEKRYSDLAGTTLVAESDYGYDANGRTTSVYAASKAAGPLRHLSSSGPVCSGPTSVMMTCAP